MPSSSQTLKILNFCAFHIQLKKNPCSCVERAASNKNQFLTKKTNENLSNDKKKKKIISKLRVTILMKLALGKRNIKDIMINLKLGIV